MTHDGSMFFLPDFANIVFEKDGKAFTNTKIIAEVLEREHAEVLKSWRALEITPEFRKGNYTVFEINDLGDRPRCRPIGDPDLDRLNQ